MAMTCTRDRKEKFILSFGKLTGVRIGNDGVSSIVADYGLEVFQDWAIDLMVEDLILRSRSAIKRNIENREALAAFVRRSDAMQAAE